MSLRALFLLAIAWTLFACYIASSESAPTTSASSLISAPFHWPFSYLTSYSKRSDKDDDPHEGDFPPEDDGDPNQDDQNPPSGPFPDDGGNIPFPTTTDHVITATPTSTPPPITTKSSITRVLAGEGLITSNCWMNAGNVMLVTKFDAFAIIPDGSAHRPSAKEFPDASLATWIIEPMFTFSSETFSLNFQTIESFWDADNPHVENGKLTFSEKEGAPSPGFVLGIKESGNFKCQEGRIQGDLGAIVSVIVNGVIETNVQVKFPGAIISPISSPPPSSSSATTLYFPPTPTTTFSSEEQHIPTPSYSTTTAIPSPTSSETYSLIHHIVEGPGVNPKCFKTDQGETAFQIDLRLSVYTTADPNPRQPTYTEGLSQMTVRFQKSTSQAGGPLSIRIIQSWNVDQERVDENKWIFTEKNNSPTVGAIVASKDLQCLQASNRDWYIDSRIDILVDALQDGKTSLVDNKINR